MMARSPAEFFRASCVLAALVATPVAAAPRSIDECEAIKQADAYNQCLASFGPAAHTGAKTSAPPSAPPSAVAEPEQEKPTAGRRRSRVPPWLAARQAEGRQRMQARSRRGVTVLSRHNGRVRTIIDVKRR